MDEPADLPEEPVDPAAESEDRAQRETAHGLAASGVAAAFALGLRHIAEPQPVNTVGTELEAPTKPVGTGKLELRFDPGSSSSTVVVVRRPPDT